MVLEICEPFDEKIGLEISTKEIIRVDFLKLILYLSASDGKISTKEVEFIKEYLEWDLPVQQWYQFIKDENICSTEFTTEIPMSLQLFVQVDNNAYNQKNDMVDICNLYITTFQMLGEKLIEVDGKIDDSKKSTLDALVRWMKKYVAEKSVRPNTVTEYQEEVIKVPELDIPKIGNINKNKHYFKCPKCGNISVNNGEFCSSCFTGLKNMAFSEENYIEPVFEKNTVV